MQISEWPQFVCSTHALSFHADRCELRAASALTCEGGCRVPVVNGIPRFVDSANYAAGFGLQWNAFRKTQLDSHTGTTISKDRVTRRLGGSLEILQQKTVLEVGCGAGRFTEILLAAGARVFACDLSNAVEANYDNCHGWPHYFVCQADARKIPVAPNSFDIVFCFGVLQHTPSPEETIAALAGYVKPGGMLLVDHYSDRYPQNFTQRNLRRLLIRLPASIAKPLTLGLARALLPLHRLTWKNRRGLWRLRAPLLRYSPLCDYRDIWPQLGDKGLAEWALLDTHDALTDYYKHFRTRDQIEATLESCGLTDLNVRYVDVNVEANARKDPGYGSGMPNR